MIIIVKKDNSETMKYYMDEVLTKRLQVKEFARNPFRGFVKEFVDYYIVNIENIYPNPFWLGVVLLAIGFFFARGTPKWWILAFGIPLYASIFWTPLFFKIMLFFGLRKNGHIGKIRYCSLKETIKSFCK